MSRRRSLLLLTIVFGLVCVLVIVGAVFLAMKMQRDAARLDEPKTGEAATTAPRDAGTARHVNGREAEAHPGDVSGTTDSDVADGTSGRGADAPDEQEAIFEDTGYAITGQVVDEQNAPVANAEVLVCLGYVAEIDRFPVVRRPVTDEVGQFRVEQLPAKDLHFAAKKGNLCSYLPGLRHHRWLARFYPVPYVEERTATPHVELILRPGGTIAGTVLDTDGQPIQAATVTIASVLDSDLEIPTDAAGRFRAACLVPGGYRVGARADGFLTIWHAASVETDRENLVIHLPRGARVEGVVVRADTLEPVPGATVRARPDSTRQDVAGKQVYVYRDLVEADERGAFEVLVRPGFETRLAATWGDYTTSEEQTVVVESEAPVPPVTLKLVHGATVSGTVLDQATETPVRSVRIRASQSYSADPWTSTDGQGNFRLGGLIPGENRLWIGSSEYEVANTPPDTRHIEVTVAGGEKLSGVNILVRRKEALSGRIENEEGKPVFGALVLVKEEQLDPARPRSWLGSRCVSDPAGRFTTHRRGGNAAMTAVLVCHPEYAHKLVEFGPNAWADTNDKEIVVVLQKGGGRVGGTVRDDAEAPIAGAVVRLQDSATFTPYAYRGGVCLTCAETDEQGRYAFAGVRPGTYEVEAQVGTRTTRSGPVEVAKDAQVADVDLVIALPGHIAGRIVEADGPPLAGFSVGCVRVRDWDWLPSTTTDDDGRYRFDGLVEGEEYRLEARPIEGMAYSRPEMRSVICSADGVDFVLEPLPTGTIKGFVYRESDGSPVKEYRLRVMSTQQRFWVDQDVVSEDGAFVCENVAAGQAVVSVRAPDLPAAQSKPFNVVAGAESTQILYVSDPGTVRGAVRRASDDSPVTAFRLSLMPVDEGGHIGYAQWEFRAKLYESEDGSFVCEGVKPGKYVLGILAEGLRDFESEPFEVVAGQETTRDLVIDEGASIHGRVIDESGRPVADVVVEETNSLRRRRQRMGIWQQSSRLEYPKATTDRSGEFTVRNLMPGEVTLKATHPDYAAKQVKTKIPAEGAATEELTIQLERGTLVHGWVKGLDGEPLTGVRMSLRGTASLTATTDHRGEYRFEHVPSGTCTIRVDYLEASLPRFQVAGEEEKEVNFDLSEAGSLSGTLVVPGDAGDVRFRLSFDGQDNLKGCCRYARPGEDRSFELRGLLPGRYKVRIHAWRDGGRRSPQVTTNPRDVTIEIGPKQQVETTIEVTAVTDDKQ